MILSEAEAALKACHRAAGFDPGNGASPKCCASVCSAWRWLGLRRNTDGAVDSSGLASRNAAQGPTDELTPVGFCGPAGKP